jgi:hypothetical protein
MLVEWASRQIELQMSGRRTISAWLSVRVSTVPTEETTHEIPHLLYRIALSNSATRPPRHGRTANTQRHRLAT